MSKSEAHSIDEIKAKYQAEREKRLRADGLAQYRDFPDVFKDGDRDPYRDIVQRDPVIEETDVAIIGAGLGGIMSAVELVKQGLSNFRVLDMAGDFGGTWYWNRYPGLACDIESYIYMPYLEETGYIPTERYAKGSEIYEHCQRIANKFDLYPKALFHTSVTSVRWLDDCNRWEISSDRGDKLRARFMTIAGGILNKPKLPGIKGMDTFKGTSFHTSRWNYDYTGGSQTEALVNLADKRVAVIGTGATAVQVVPKLAEAAQQLYVLQRTPSGVGPRLNRPTDPEWASSLKPGWQKERIENFTRMVSGQSVEQDLVKDGWTEIFSRNPNAFGVTGEEEQAVDIQAMEDVRARIDEIVEDPKTAEALKPWYHQMCKRPCFHDYYLPAFNRPNVKLIDTDGKGVEGITENAVVVDGVEYPVDCIVYASGFHSGATHTTRLGFEIYGRDGISLTDAWANGPSTLHGMLARGFPNYFSLYMLQGGIAVNFAHLLSELTIHSAWLISETLKRGVEVIEPSVAAQEAWFNTLLANLGAQALFFSECTPGYNNGEGATPTEESALRGIPYFGPTLDYIQILRDWREEGSLAGLETD